MQFKPPPITREFRYWIREGAVDRFRELAEEENRPLNDLELARVLDERIHGALLGKQFEVVIDKEAPGEDTTLVTIQARNKFKQSLLVVMRMIRPNSFPRPPRCIGTPGTAALGAITVLSYGSAQHNFQHGKWHRPTRPLEGKLTNVRSAPPTPPPAPPPVVPPPRPAPVSPPDDEEPETDEDTNTSTLVERLHYARLEIIRRPNMRVSGKDGVISFVKSQFGKGLSWQTASQLKEQVLEELEQGSRGAPALVELPVTSTRVVQASPAPAPRPAPLAPSRGMRPTVSTAEREHQAELGVQLTQALADEARCKVVEVNAIRAREEATGRVEAIMRNIQAQRE